MKKILIILMLTIVTNLDAAWTHVYVDCSVLDTSGTGNSHFSPYKFIGQIGENDRLVDSCYIHLVSGTYEEGNYSRVDDYSYLIGTGHDNVKIVSTGKAYIKRTGAAANIKGLTVSSNIELYNLKIGVGFIQFLSSCSGVVSIKHCVFHGYLWPIYNFTSATVTFFDCQIGQTTASAFVRSFTSVTASFNHCTFSNPNSVSASTVVVGDNNSFTTMSFTNCAFDYCLISTADVSSYCSFDNCIYSNNVTDRNAYTWTNSNNSDPEIAWNSSKFYFDITSTSPCKGNANDYGDIGAILAPAISTGTK